MLLGKSFNNYPIPQIHLRVVKKHHKSYELHFLSYQSYQSYQECIMQCLLKWYEDHYIYWNIVWQFNVFIVRDRLQMCF